MIVKLTSVFLKIFSILYLFLGINLFSTRILNSSLLIFFIKLNSFKKMFLSTAKDKFKLPNEKSIIIDSKVSLTHYEKLLRTNCEIEKNKLTNDFLKTFSVVLTFESILDLEIVTGPSFFIHET